MKSVKRKWVFIFLSLVFGGLNPEVWAVPPLPHTVYGSVKSNGANVPDGTAVSAWIGGVQYGSTTTMTYEGDSVFAFHVPGDNLDTAPKEGGLEGEIISFRAGINGANRSLSHQSGGSTRMDLTTDGTLSDVSVAQDMWCGGRVPCFNSIQMGIHSAVSYTEISMSAEIYNEDVILDSSKVLMLQGGWNPTFTTHSSSTTINGSLTIGDGKVIVEGIILK